MCLGESQAHCGVTKSSLSLSGKWMKTANSTRMPNFKQVGLWSLGQNGSVKVMKRQSMTISRIAVLMNIQFASW